MKSVRPLLLTSFVFFITLSCSSDHLDPIEDIEDFIENSTNTGGERDSSNSSSSNGSNGNNNPFDGYETYIVESYKRAQQFTDIIWESQALIAGAYNQGRHKGMPYSLANEYNKYIGFDVSIKTFMTAVHNKHSLLYTENISSKNSKSSYGIKYQGNSSYCASYMGTVCSFFVSYVLGQKIPYYTYEYNALEKLGIIEKIEDQSVNGIEFMDVILESGHVSIITNINRSQNGEIINLTWSESDNPFVKSKVMDPLEFKNRLDKRKGTIYRFKDWANSQAYKASEFVATYGESISDYKYNDDICTFAGDYACFREGDLLVINYEKGNYTTMELMKNDEIIAKIDLPTDASSHSINLKDMNLSYGMYKARLAGRNGYSDYTHFEIIQTNVSFDDYGDNQRISFHSENGKPIYIQFCSRIGVSYGKYLLSENDLDNGYAIVDAKSLLELYRNRTFFGDDVYVKVFFQGQYGRVTNHFLKTNLK